MPPSPPVILIVDDEAYTRRLLKKVLLDEGYQIIEAENGIEAVNRYVQESPDLVLMDAMMPEMDGFEACMRIKALPESAATPILILTALDGDDAIEAAFNAGAIDYIPKPIHWVLLRHRLRHLINLQQTTQALAQQKQRLSQLLAHAPVGLLSVNAQGILTEVRGRILEANAAAWLGQPVQAVLQDAPGLLHHIRQALQARTGEISLQLALEQRVLEYHLVPKMFLHGRVEGLVLTVYDITEQERIKEMEVATERTKVRVLSEFISHASHDLRTPLAVIKTALYLLGRDQNPHTQQKRVVTMQQQVVHLERVLDKMFVMTTLDTMPDLVVKRLDLNYLVQMALESLENALQNRDLMVAVLLHPDPLPIMGDGESLSRAFANLIDNAITYTPDGGRIVIRTQLIGDQVIFDLRDTGIGISAEDLPRIFDRFFRGATNRPTGGVGLGLSIVKRTLELHRADIMVESTPQRGSHFQVLLPLAP